jgi:uncharacterized protein YqcC (DUF446 family)
MKEKELKLQIEQQIEKVRAEMRRIGFWRDAPVTPSNGEALFSGRTFEEWLQFEYLVQVEQSLSDKMQKPALDYKVGLAALRQYDYHSSVPLAMGLLDLLEVLEKLVSAWKGKIA